MGPGQQQQWQEVAGHTAAGEAGVSADAGAAFAGGSAAAVGTGAAAAAAAAAAVPTAIEPVAGDQALLHATESSSPNSQAAAAGLAAATAAGGTGSQAAPEGSGLDALAASKVLWAAANLRLSKRGRWLRVALARLPPNTLCTLPPERLACVAWAVGRLGAQPDQQWADGLMLACCRGVPRFTGRQLLRVAFGVSRFRVLPALALREYFCEMAACRVGAMEEADAQLLRRLLAAIRGDEQQEEQVVVQHEGQELSSPEAVHETALL